MKALDNLGLKIEELQNKSEKDVKHILKKKYANKALLLHPDKCKNCKGDAEFQDLNKYYRLLIDNLNSLKQDFKHKSVVFDNLNNDVTISVSQPLRNMLNKKNTIKFKYKGTPVSIDCPGYYAPYYEYDATVTTNDGSKYNLDITINYDIDTPIEEKEYTFIPNFKVFQDDYTPVTILKKPITLKKEELQLGYIMTGVTLYGKQLILNAVSINTNENIIICNNGIPFKDPLTGSIQSSLLMVNFKIKK